MTFLAGCCGVRGKVLAGATFVVMLSASSAAFAQNCTTTQSGPANVTNIGNLAVPTGAASASISAAIGNVNTAFLTQQGSAFVSAPANPVPDQPGGGIWVRGVGGEVNLGTTSNSTVTTRSAAAGGAVVNTANTACANSTRENFAGVQLGTDIARLNWNGWNVHLGTTVGYLGAKATDNNGFSNTFEVPFFGTYVVATKGRFFADLMVREEFYNVNLFNAPLSFVNQPVGAHGYSISTSAGYNFDVGNNWFIEPSAGFVYSSTSLDNFTSPGTFGAIGTGIAGTIQTNDVISEIGRLSLRVGKVIQTPTVIWQPFASASVFHEFAGNVVSNFVSNNGALTGAFAGPATFTQTTSTSRVGTYGQYSLGVAGQIVNTGWLGFVRVDYRNGDNINGWSGNAGIRYQFTPTDWTGFYVGGFFGGAAGRTDITFPATATAGNRPWVFGPIGGGQIGYNRQINQWVFGVEGDIAAANVHGARTAGSQVFLPGFTSTFFTVQDKTTWMATATGRVGYAMGRTLFYVKGGAAFEDSTITTTCFSPGVNFNPAINPGGPAVCSNQAGTVFPSGSGFGTSRTRVGWTLGYGTEFDLGKNWSAKAEYDYLSFGRHTALASDGTTVMTDRSDISQVKVGLNYRFVPGAVVAKY
jgi:opacity protein-like surface antigen